MAPPTVHATATVIHAGRTYPGTPVYVAYPYGAPQYFVYLNGDAGRYYVREVGAGVFYTMAN
jgi:hypothetical protein